ARDGYEADLNRLCIYHFATGTKRYLNWKSDVEAFCWAPQGVKSEKRKVKRSLTPNPSPKGEGSRIKDLKDLKGFLKPEP
ncbi:MAG: hypothetical protein II400_00070, partial [Bacteroidaceae bacterium]|nr:hypothetical protein [Bacteroidaceae bacterium]